MTVTRSLTSHPIVCTFLILPNVLRFTTTDGMDSRVGDDHDASKDREKKKLKQDKNGKCEFQADERQNEKERERENESIELRWAMEEECFIVSITSSYSSSSCSTRS